MKRCKHERQCRTIGPFRAIDAVYLAVHRNHASLWWEHVPWRYRASDLPARIIDQTIRYQIGWYYGEDHEYQAKRLAVLTGLEVLRREVAARRPLTWAVISEAVSVAKAVMRCYEDGREELRWIEEQRVEAKHFQVEFARTHPDFDVIAHLEDVDRIYDAWADEVMRRHIGYDERDIRADRALAL